MSTAPLINRLGLCVWTARSERGLEPKPVAKRLHMRAIDLHAIERGDVLPDDDQLVAISIVLGLDPDALRVLRAADRLAQEAVRNPPPPELPDVPGVWYVPAASGMGHRPLQPVTHNVGIGKGLTVPMQTDRVAGIFGGPVQKKPPSPPPTLYVPPPRDK